MGLSVGMVAQCQGRGHGFEHGHVHDVLDIEVCTMQLIDIRYVYSIHIPTLVHAYILETFLV